MPSNNKILIIDDETDLCLLLKDYFVRKNYEVHVAHSLNDGLLMLDVIKPGVLFLDNNLPDGIGWALAPQIAANHPGMYTVMVSAFHPQIPIMPEHAQFTILEKPFSKIDLDRQFSDF